MMVWEGTVAEPGDTQETLELVVRQASVTYNWSPGRVLPVLPTPGTESFATLVSGLAEFRITAQDIWMETPTSRMSDVALIVAILRGQIILRITYSGLEIKIKELLDDHLPLIPRVTVAVASAIGGIIESDASLTIDYSSHVDPPIGTAQPFLSRRLPCDGAILAPESCTYAVRLLERPDIVVMRIQVAKSLMFDDALFVAFRGEYHVRGIMRPTLVERFYADFVQALSLLGLRLREA